ncbi:MAG: vanadium-dependent haloperoxidase [Saprospiraceae bacterium]|nr:vanadium-dependent haloperoxidase [Saprospiraceae bacterium]MBP7642154.1 vanadium-dependent haloperoxidase [Saprospiraceae bacterium]HMS67458.1 vanadium-dependent haloperoxidase [Saprospiraceae bacterium]
MMIKKYFKLHLWMVLIVPVLFITSCQKDLEESEVDSISATEYDSEVPFKWNELLIEIDRYSPNYRPPAAARMMGYIGLAVYEGVVPGMADYKSLKSEFVGLSLPSIEKGKEYHWPTVANAIYAEMFRAFYPHIDPKEILKIDLLEKKFYDQFGSEVSDEVKNRSKFFGIDVAKAVFAYSATDQYGHEAFKNPRPSSYVPPKFGSKGEPLWQPTWPDYTPALFPFWGQVRTFAMKESDLRAKPPLEYSENKNSKFYQQALEIKIWVDNLNHEDKWIGQFWSDDFFGVTFEPAARQLAIANQILKQDEISLAKSVELYAKMGMAMSDAAVSIWNSKFIYNVRRPIEYIRDVIDQDWKTALNHPQTNVEGLTPEFPAYPSGHSGFGGSASLILTDIFGNNRAFTDNCHVNRFEFLGTPRTYSSFIEAGIENAYSRLPLGVHYRMDCEEGLRLGYLAANRVLNLPWKK